MPRSDTYSARSDTCSSNPSLDSHGDLGATLLVILLVPTAMMMHAFWKETDAGAQQMEMVQFTKDISLAGAALAFVWVFSLEGIDLTLTGPLLGLR